MAFAERHHHGADVLARVLAALSPGSALDGLLNAAVDWRTAPAYGCRPARWASRCSSRGSPPASGRR